MEPEDAKEEISERIKHFNKEVPPQTNVGCEVGEQELDAIRRRQKFPRSSYQERHMQ